MARLHSRKKGKSGTKRPKSLVVPEWTSVDKAAVEGIVVKMAREGVPASKIGLYLRDQQGIPNVRVILGCTILAYMRKNKVAPEVPEDLSTLVKRATHLRLHLKSFKKDTANGVKLVHLESKIQRLFKYYSAKGVLPKSWKYEQE